MKGRVGGVYIIRPSLRAIGGARCDLNQGRIQREIIEK